MRINKAVFSRKSFFSHSALVVSEVITLYRVFLKMFKLRKVGYTITKVGELACGLSACSLPQEVRLRASRSKNFPRSCFHS